MTRLGYHSFLVFFAATTTILSCATTGQKPPASVLSIQSADMLKAGSTHLDELKMFGAPAHTFYDEAGHAQVLTFCAQTPCLHESLVCRVDKTTNIVQSFVWLPNMGDPESNIEGALKHYSDLGFEKRRLQYDYGHYFHRADQYFNKERGITVTYDPEKKIVVRIHHGNPNSPNSRVASNNGFPIVTVLPDRDTASSPQSQE